MITDTAENAKLLLITGDHGRQEEQMMERNGDSQARRPARHQHPDGEGREQGAEVQVLAQVRAYLLWCVVCVCVCV